MQKGSLTFHITKASFKLYDSDQYSQAFIKSLGLKVHSGCWSTIELDSPIFPDFIKEAKWRLEIGEAKFYGLNRLFLQEIQESYDWYVLNPRQDIDWNWENSVFSCKAYKIPANIHAASGPYYNHFVSEKFVETCKQNNLTGIDFVWCVDTGKYQSMQWYVPIAQNPLGRGFDHPWFDPCLLHGPGSWQPAKAVFRTGVWHFKNNQVRKDAVFENPLYEEILHLFHGFDLSIISFRRFLRKYLPSTDFAYIWRGEDDNDSGSMRERKLCMNRRAKECLVRANVLREKELEPILIFNELPSGSILLDGSAELPCPFYSLEELIEIRKQVDKLWGKHTKTVKPPRKVTQKEALKMFRQTKKERPADFQKGIRKDKLEKAGIVLPGYWVEMLSIANGCMLDADCVLLPADKIREFDQEKQKYIQSIQEDYPYTYVAVGYGADGDWFALDTSQQNDTDCKVFRISHEDLSIFDSWDSIPFFISEILSGYYE